MQTEGRVTRSRARLAGSDQTREYGAGTQPAVAAVPLSQSHRSDWPSLSRSGRRGQEPARCQDHRPGAPCQGRRQARGQPCASTGAVQAGGGADPGGGERGGAPVCWVARFVKVACPAPCGRTQPSSDCPLPLRTRMSPRRLISGFRRRSPARRCRHRSPWRPLPTTSRCSRPLPSRPRRQLAWRPRRASARTAPSARSRRRRSPR